MKIKEQTRKLAAGCSKYSFEVVDKTDEVSDHIYGKVKLTQFDFDFRRVLLEHYQQSRTEEGLFIKLVEEVGEVAEVLNGRSGRKEGVQDSNEELAKELADIIHYTVAIAAINHIDLTNTIFEKDKLQPLSINMNVIWKAF